MGLDVHLKLENTFILRHVLIVLQRLRRRFMIPFERIPEHFVVDNIEDVNR